MMLQRNGKNSCLHIGKKPYRRLTAPLKVQFTNGNATQKPQVQTMFHLTPHDTGTQNVLSPKVLLTRGKLSALTKAGNSVLTCIQYQMCLKHVSREILPFKCARI